VSPFDVVVEGLSFAESIFASCLLGLFLCESLVGKYALNPWKGHPKYTPSTKIMNELDLLPPLLVGSSDLA
jgi:hypothetical protein